MCRRRFANLLDLHKRLAQCQWECHSLQQGCTAAGNRLKAVGVVGKLAQLAPAAAGTRMMAVPAADSHPTGQLVVIAVINNVAPYILVSVQTKKRVKILLSHGRVQPFACVPGSRRKQAVVEAAAEGAPPYGSYAGCCCW